LLLAAVLLVTACSASTSNAPSVSAAADPSAAASAGGGPAGSGAASQTPAPSSSDTVAAMRDAEANLRRAARETAGLAKLGPGALELAGFMDLTGSFLLTQSQAKIHSRGPSSGGHLAAPLRDFPPPGAASFGTYAMTVVVFEFLVSDLNDKGLPASKTEDLAPTVDTVTIGGNKGKITTQITASAGVTASKVSLLLRMKITGEVRDAATGALLYKIDSETTGTATGDACPDASGIARAKMTFRGHEDYFNAGGATSSSTEDYGGDIQIKADDNAKLAGVSVSASGGVMAEPLIRLAAKHAAPAFEKAWRSGICVAIEVDPESGDVDADSVTTVKAKLKHKIEGNELDKPIAIKLGAGVKKIEPDKETQKAPATIKYTAGPNEGDKGDVDFDSVSNRGIAHLRVTFTVGARTWVINSTGTFLGTVNTGVGSGQKSLTVTITGLKVSGGMFDTLSGTGTMAIHGAQNSGGSGPSCNMPIDKTYSISASGTLVGKGAGAILRLTLATENDGDHELPMRCSFAGKTYDVSDAAAGTLGEYGEMIGEFDLPADGGTKTVSSTETSPFTNRTVTGTFKAARAKR
jgi:hypothetical protein